MRLFGKKRELEETLDERRDKIINNDTPFAVREAYKALRTNVMFSIPKKNCKRIMVTSSMAGEGKSTNSINLAMTVAETGAKVLLIDCDLRRPNVANLLLLKKDRGLSNMLAGYNSYEDVVIRDVQKNLDVITAGEIPPNPTELLGSTEFSDFLDAMSEKYGYIILDTSPINLVTDSVLLSKLVDGIVLVVRCNSTAKDSVNDAINSLKMVDAKILGFVFNDVENSGKGGYGKYGKYSNYGYGDNTAPGRQQNNK